MQTRFNFVGEVSLPKADSKKPLFKEFAKDGRKMRSINFGIKESDHNMGFVEAFDAEVKTIKTKDKDGNDIEINWSDRLDDDVVATVDSFRTTTVNLGEDFGGKQTFLRMFDAIGYLNENLPKFHGKLCVVGQMRKDFYQGKVYDKFVINNVYAVDEDRKNRLLITTDFYYNKDSVDKSDWKSEKKIYVDGYVEQYINKDLKNKYVPQRLVFNASKYNQDNDKHRALLDYKLKYIDINAKKMQHLIWECVLLNGSEEVPFDESQLTKSQREQIELGIRTIDDFKPAGSLYGERIIEYRMFDPKLTGDFSDGLVDTEMSVSEFEENVYIPPTDEKLEEVIAKAEKKSESEDIDDEDLF